MSSIRRQRPSSSYVPYPAVILEPAILDHLGIIAGTRTDEQPPKVVMTRADWDKLVAAIKRTEELGDTALAQPAAPHRAIAFLGKTWQDNPLIEPPPGMEPGRPPAARPYKYRGPKRPGQFAHLKELPTAEAMIAAQEEHAARIQDGMSDEDSTLILIRALEIIKRAAENRVEPRPLPTIEGEDPPTPTEMRQATQKAD